MGAKVSAEMLKARKMIEAGATAYRAAKDCGVTVSAITRSKWYQARPKPDATPDAAMERARHMVTLEGQTAYAAAKMTGVAQSSISRAAWYREYINGLISKHRKGGNNA